MDLVSLERVSGLFSRGVSGEDGSRLRTLITSVSARAETLMDRVALAGARTDYLNVRSGQLTFHLKAWPVTAVTGVWFDPDQTFGTSTALGSTDYLDPTLDERGILEVRTGLYEARRALKVSYTGGMAADTAAFEAAYPDVADAVSTQVIHQFQMRHAPGASVKDSGRGHSRRATIEEWVPAARDAIYKHRRMMGAF